MDSLSGLAPVIPLGGMIMGAGYANTIYKVSSSDEYVHQIHFPCDLRVEMLCNIVTVM